MLKNWRTASSPFYASNRSLRNSSPKRHACSRTSHGKIRQQKSFPSTTKPASTSKPLNLRTPKPNKHSPHHPMTPPLISFYFQVHQPYRLRDLRITEIGREGISYFDEAKNRAVFRKVAEKCYLP